MKLKKVYSSEKTTILAVDDNPASLRLMVSMLERAGCEVIEATGGKEAMEILLANKDGVDIILLDRIMPGMNGVEFCHLIKADEQLRCIPVIMQTIADRPEEIKEGIEAGVFYYLIKPLVSETLLSIVASAQKQARMMRQFKNELLQRTAGIGLVQNMTCTYKTLEEAETLATFLAQVFPDPDLAITGITELFLNAVEHGNLGIDYEQKSRLVAGNCWKQEVEKRLSDPLFKDKKVTVIIDKKEDAFRILIEDEGDGFNWQKYLRVDATRATSNHGRGIAMANLISFDELLFNAKGNQVTGIVYKK